MKACYILLFSLLSLFMIIFFIYIGYGMLDVSNKYYDCYQELQRVTQLYCQQECLRRESDPYYKYTILTFCEDKSCDWWLENDKNNQ